MDDQLIEKIKSGNDHAFRILVEKYRNLVFHTAYGVLRNEKDAEDAAQEVFLKIYTSLPNMRSKVLQRGLQELLSIMPLISKERKREDMKK